MVPISSWPQGVNVPKKEPCSTLITNVRDEMPIPLIRLPSNFKFDSYFFCLKILHRGDNLVVFWYALNFVMIRSIFYSDDNFHWIWKSTEIFHLLEGICVGQSNGKHTHVLLLHKVGIQLRQADKTCGRKKKKLTHRGIEKWYIHRFRSTLAQVMAWCQMAPSHYLNHCWLTIKGVLWYSPENNFTSTHGPNL